MKKNLLKWSVVAGVAIISTGTSYAQFTVDGQIISRGEYRHGFKSLVAADQDPAFFVEQRSRMKFTYGAEKFKVGFSVQDIRTWGSVSQLNKTDGYTSFHEAWGEYLVNKKFSVKVGRQEWDYDDARILGNVDWAMQARSHDGALFKYTDSTWQLHAGLAFNQNAGETSVGTVYPSTFSNYKAMQFLWFHKDWKNLNASFLFMNNGMQTSYLDTAGVTIYETKFTQTIGTRIQYGKNSLKVNVAGYYQMGEDGALKKSDGKTPKEVGGAYGNLEVIYTHKKMLAVTLGGEYMTGNSQTDTTSAYKAINHAFTPFYGTNHKFNGFMDYFYVGNHANNVGLIDAYLRLKFMKEKYWVMLDVHQFMAAADVLDQKELTNSGKYTAMSSTLGTEIDLTFNYTLAKFVNLQLGYSHLLASETMEAIKGGKSDELNNWAYVMIAFKPELFKSSK
jgi:hypothetical protein